MNLSPRLLAHTVYAQNQSGPTMDLLSQEMCADLVLTRTELPEQKLCARRSNNWVKQPNNTY